MEDSKQAPFAAAAAAKAAFASVQDKPFPNDIFTAPELRWAVIGCGVIANQMAQSLALAGRKLAGVANRTLSKAQSFAEQYGVEKVYETVEDLYADPDIDAVYITTPHNTHITYLRAALAAGKHVLCEKAITLNSAELDEARAIADEHNVVLMDATTVLHMPLYQELRRRMDAANLPVWADERPETLVVLVDPAAPADAARVPAPDAPVTDAQLVLDTASSRGLPVALLEAPDGAAGAAEDPLQVAQAEAARVGADLVLIGRRAPVSGSAAWRWTLQDGAERSEWQGDATQGVHRLADQLAARYAVAAAASSRLRLEVQGVGSSTDYGRLQDYLRSVGVIESLAMSSLRGDSIVYELVVRGSADQLRDALALKNVLLPVAPADGVAVSTADLVYRISSAP